MIHSDTGKAMKANINQDNQLFIIWIYALFTKVCCRRVYGPWSHDVRKIAIRVFPDTYSHEFWWIRQSVSMPVAARYNVFSPPSVGRNWKDKSENGRGSNKLKLKMSVWPRNPLFTYYLTKNYTHTATHPHKAFWNRAQTAAAKRMFGRTKGKSAYVWVQKETIVRRIELKTLQKYKKRDEKRRKQKSYKLRGQIGS